MEKGWSNHITRESSEIYMYNVPSEQDSSLSYRTCPAECFCSCPVGLRGQVCKHLVLLDVVKDKDNYSFPELALQLEAHAKALQDKGHFSVCCDIKMEISVESLCGRGTYTLSLKTFLCTCCTFSYHDICPCLILAQQLFGVTINEKRCFSINQTDNANLDFMQQDSSSDLQKLEEVLEIVKRWQTVPENIKRQINYLYVNVHQEDISLLSKRHCTNDTSMKIQTIFSHNAKHRKKTVKTASKKTSQVTYVTMVPRMGNETLRPLGVATGNALSVTRSEDTYEKTPPVGRRQPMTSLPAYHNISAAGRIHHQLLRLKLASEAWSKA